MFTSPYQSVNKAGFFCVDMLQACVPLAVRGRLQAARCRREPASVQASRAPWEAPPHTRELRPPNKGKHMGCNRSAQHSCTASVARRGGPENCPTGRSEPRAPSVSKRSQEAGSKKQGTRQ
jgi:hypothetical protein